MQPDMGTLHSPAMAAVCGTQHADSLPAVSLGHLSSQEALAACVGLTQHGQEGPAAWVERHEGQTEGSLQGVEVGMAA